MTLDEAIKHAEEVAEEKDKFINKTYATFGEDRLLFKEEENECKKCANEHRQLAKWLKDYKRLLEQEPVIDKIRAEIAEIQLIGYATVDGKREIASRAVLQILDKYKAESEET
jgi:hypothetical protein